MFLSVVIPAHNEEKRMLVTLEKISAFLKAKGYSHEIIVVDDGSTDNTVNVVEAFSKKNNEPIQILKSSFNYGKGHAVRKGVLASSGDYILFSDADLSTPIEEIEKFLPLFQEGYDVVIGSRALRDSQLLIRKPWYRENMGRIFNLFVRMFVMKGIKDTQCGFKVFKNEVAKKIFEKLNIEHFAFDVEALFIARRLGYKIRDVPVVWIDSLYSRVHIIRDSLRMINDLFRIFIYNLTGEYHLKS